MDLLDRLADQVHPACGQVLGPEQGDGVGECGGTHGYHRGLPSAADRWAPGPEAASVPLVGFTGHPSELLITKTVGATGEPQVHT